MKRCGEVSSFDLHYAHGFCLCCIRSGHQCVQDAHDVKRVFLRQIPLQALTKFDTAVAGLQKRQIAFTNYKDYIGMDITSLVTLPVWIMEPYTILQKVAEIMEYTELLDKAASTEDPYERSVHTIVQLGLDVVGHQSTYLPTLMLWTGQLPHGQLLCMFFQVEFM